jgi:3-phosphoshikimate 1-carboxyvinyltransferase
VITGTGVRSWPDLVVSGIRDTAHSVRTTTVPGDKSITHRALLTSLMTDSPTEIRGANLGGAVLHLLDPLARLGIKVRRNGTTLSLFPGGTSAEACPRLDVRESSAAARLLIGVLAGRGIQAVVDGDEVLRNRPMEWVVEPLTALGACIDYMREPGRLPVMVRSGITRAARIELAVGSAQARSAVLTACVTAGIPVSIRRSVRSRNHTERLLTAMGATIREDDDGVEYAGGAIRQPPVIDVPGDPSLAAYAVATELLSPVPADVGLTIRGVCLNPTRIGFLETLRRAGAGIAYRDVRQQAGEPVGTIEVHGGLAGVRPPQVADAFTLHSLIDEVPLLSAVASVIDGPSVIGAAQELSFKETNRLTTTTAMLRGFGARIRATLSSLHIDGGRPLQAGATDSFGDHRLGMTAATLAASLPGTTLVRGGTCHATSFPEFVDHMAALGVNLWPASGTERCTPQPSV